MIARRRCAFSPDDLVSFGALGGAIFVPGFPKFNARSIPIWACISGPRRSAAMISAAVAACPVRVLRVISTVHRSLPVYPD